MATADQLKALVRSHASGDERHFYSVALQVAARAARRGQNRFAQELRDLIDEANINPNPHNTCTNQRDPLTRAPAVLRHL